MTQPPIVPGQPGNQYWPPQPVGPPVKPPSPKLAFWTSATGIICMLLIAGAAVLGIAIATDIASGPASDNFTVTVTSCSASTGSLSTAKIGFTIKNTSTAARSATVKIEYRDGAGNRIDTDTAIVKTIQPGDMASVAESTLLDGAADGTIRCAITGIS